MLQTVTRTGAARIVRRHPARLHVDEDIELWVVRESDAPALFALTDRSRESLRRWLPWVDGTRSVAGTRRFIRTARDRLRQNDGFQVVIRYRGELAGAMGYHYWDWTAGKTEIGYWLAPPFEGKGIMTRSCRALVDYAFLNLGLNRVEIRAAVGNTRSRAIPERLGFRQEGILREAERTPGGLVDEVVYALLRSEWEAARKGAPRSL